VETKEKHDRKLERFEKFKEEYTYPDKGEKSPRDINLSYREYDNKKAKKAWKPTKPEGDKSFMMETVISAEKKRSVSPRPQDKNNLLNSHKHSGSRSNSPSKDLADKPLTKQQILDKSIDRLSQPKYKKKEIKDKVKDKEDEKVRDSQKSKWSEKVRDTDAIRSSKNYD